MNDWRYVLCAMCYCFYLFIQTRCVFVFWFHEKHRQKQKSQAASSLYKQRERERESSEQIYIHTYGVCNTICGGVCVFANEHYFMLDSFLPLNFRIDEKRRFSRPWEHFYCFFILTYLHIVYIALTIRSSTKSLDPSSFFCSLSIYQCCTFHTS